MNEDMKIHFYKKDYYFCKTKINLEENLNGFFWDNSDSFWEL